MYFLFDEVGLLIVVAGCFLGGFLPLLILMMITPEAREHIKCRVTGGIIVEKFWDTGQCAYVVAKPKGGEGQYIAGKNAFGQREIFVKPRMEDRFVNKPFLLSGMRRLKYFAYAGKTPIVNHDTLMAIETVESPEEPLVLPAPFVDWAKKKYPAMLKDFDAEANNGGSKLREKALAPELRQWAEQYGVTVSEDDFVDLPEPIYGKPDKTGLVSVVGAKNVRHQVKKDVYYKLTALDPRKLKHYFSDHYDESQIDNLLEEARIEGLQEGREGKRFQIGMLGKVAIAFIVIAIVGVIVVIGLQGGL